jgi:hypothetical protein
MLPPQGALRVKTSSSGRATTVSWCRNLLEGVVFEAPSLEVVELASSATGSALVRVAVWALRVLGF